MENRIVGMAFLLMMAGEVHSYVERAHFRPDEALQANTLPLNESVYGEHIENTRIDFPPDTRIVFQHFSGDVRADFLTRWAFYSKSRIVMPGHEVPNEWNPNGGFNIQSRKEITERLYGDFQRDVKSQNPVFLRCFTPEDTSYASHWQKDGIAYYGHVFTSHGSSVLHLLRIGK